MDEKDSYKETGVNKRQVNGQFRSNRKDDHNDASPSKKETRDNAKIVFLPSTRQQEEVFAILTSIFVNKNRLQAPSDED
jgi:hypothetical protein